MTAASDDTPLPPLPPRDPAGHKGTFGTVLVVGGCATGDVRMIGAPALAALAALRAGCGLARIAAPEPILTAAINICPSATGIPLPVDSSGALIPHEVSRLLDEHLASARCIIVGPGLGSGQGPRTAALRLIQQEDIPVVLDADALTALAEIPELHRDFRAAAILTPHPGEYRRLANSLNLAHDPTRDETRPRAAEELAQRLGAIVILKGHRTVVSDGQRTWMCPRGSAVLATAGTGDVLAGLIAGLVAQFVPPPSPLPTRRTPGLDLYNTARLAVEAHARAGELWQTERHAAAGLLAPELADLIPEALDQLRP